MEERNLLMVLVVAVRDFPDHVQKDCDQHPEDELGDPPSRILDSDRSVHEKS